MLETRARETYVELVLDAAVPVDDEEPRDSSAIPAGLPLGRVRASSDADGGDQFAVTESDIRLDGRPRARAVASHPGVVLAFDSRHGPLKYAVDTFDRWQDNLRAIALGLEHLRAVDRYGVTRRGEQYTGWRQIE